MVGAITAGSVVVVAAVGAPVSAVAPAGFVSAATVCLFDTNKLSVIEHENRRSRISFDTLLLQFLCIQKRLCFLKTNTRYSKPSEVSLTCKFGVNVDT